MGHPKGGHIQELQIAVPCSQSSVSATGKRTFHGGRNVLWLHHSTWQPFAPWAYPAPETCICAIPGLNFEQCLISTDLKGQRTKCSYIGLLDSADRGSVCINPSWTSPLALKVADNFDSHHVKDTEAWGDRDIVLVPNQAD